MARGETTSSRIMAAWRTPSNKKKKIIPISAVRSASNRGRSSIPQPPLIVIVYAAIVILPAAAPTLKREVSVFVANTARLKSLAPRPPTSIPFRKSLSEAPTIFDTSIATAHNINDTLTKMTVIISFGKTFLIP